MLPGVSALDENGLAQAAKSATVPLVVDFWAPWCAPCRAVAPVFAKLAEEFGERARFASVNIDASPAIARRYAVRSIPTILVLRDGRVVGSAIGAQPADHLRQLVHAAL